MRADDLRSLGIIVVNYGSHDLIEANLGPIALDEHDVCVIIVDNFSTQAEREAIRATTSAHGWSLVSLDSNRGFGAAVNEGVCEAGRLGCSSVLLVNPDATVTADVIAELHAQCAREPNAMIAPRILAPNGAVFFAGAEVLPRDGSIRSRAGALRDGHIPGAQPWLTAACLAMSSRIVRPDRGIRRDLLPLLGRRGPELPSRTRRHRPGRTRRSRGRARRRWDAGHAPRPRQVRPLLLLQLPQPTAVRGAQPRPPRRSSLDAADPGGELADPASGWKAAVAAVARPAAGGDSRLSRRAVAGYAGAPATARRGALASWMRRHERRADKRRCRRRRRPKARVR